MAGSLLVIFIVIAVVIAVVIARDRFLADAGVWRHSRPPLADGPIIPHDRQSRGRGT
jgi:hypothetical protein